jgi:protein ImuB
MSDRARRRRAAGHAPRRRADAACPRPGPRARAAAGGRGAARGGDGLLQYTPQVAEAEEATLLMDVGASLRLFGGIRALCRRVRANVRALGFYGLAQLRADRARRLAAGARNAGRALDVKMASLVRRLDRWRSCCCRRRGPTPAGSKASAASRWARCGACRVPACSGAAAARCSTCWTPPTAWRPSCTNGSRRRPPSRAPGTVRPHRRRRALLLGARRLLLQLTGWLCARQLAVERIAAARTRARQGGARRRPASRSRWPNRPGATNTWCAC